MSDLLWMNMQLSERGLSRMWEEENATHEEQKPLLAMLAETYLAPFHRHQNTLPDTNEGQRKCIFGDTPGSYDRRNKLQ